MGLNLIYWTLICGRYFLEGSISDKYRKIWTFFQAARTGVHDSGNIAQAAMANWGL